MGKAGKSPSGPCFAVSMHPHAIVLDDYRALEEAVDRLLQGYKRDDIDEARKALTEAAASLRGAL